jgi:hypothetical protein
MACRYAVLNAGGLHAHDLPPGASLPGLEVYLGDLFQNLIVYGKIRHELSSPGVLFFISFIRFTSASCIPP